LQCSKFLIYASHNVSCLLALEISGQVGQ